MTIRTSDSTKFLVTALIEFHKSEVSVPKSASNPFFKSKYADLWTIKAACDPVLSGLGLVVTQFPGDNGSGPTLVTRLCHVSGEFMEAETPLFMPKDTPQDQGSAITYMRRYSYSAILGIVADPDDDAERAMQRERPKPKATRSSGPVFVPPTETDYEEVNGEQIPLSPRMETTRSGPPSDLATPKQVGYLKKLLDEQGFAQEDIVTMVAQHCPPWPDSLRNLTKAQASTMIELVKP
jgi:hypothetical protein